MVRREREIGEQSIVYIKRLELVTPQYAAELGLKVDKPVFTANTDSTPLIYNVGKTVKIEGFFDPLDTGTVHDNYSGVVYHKNNIGEKISVISSHPRVGIGYHQRPAKHLDEWGNREVSSWMAVVEPTGQVVEHEDYLFNFNRITNELRVKEIRAFCTACKAGPLKEGKAIEVYRNGFIFAVCNSEIHDASIAQRPEWLSPKVTFELAETGEIVFKET